MKKNDHPYLLDILDRIARIEEYIAPGKEDFLSKTITQDAIIRNFEVIGEATKHLSSVLKEQYSHIPWKDIAGMRDKVIHDYVGVDLSLVWSIATEKIPTLKKTIEQILKELSQA